MNPTSLINVLLAYANQLKFKNLFLLIFCLFIIDLIIPDMIPMIDEIILGLSAILLASWKNGKEEQRTLIEGEIVEEDDK
jgi:hypothetical protein